MDKVGENARRAADLARRLRSSCASCGRGRTRRSARRWNPNSGSTRVALAALSWLRETVLQDHLSPEFLQVAAH